MSSTNYMYAPDLDDDVWMKKQDAAERVGCTPYMILAVAKEMASLGLEGVWLDGQGRIYRLNPKAVKEYIYHRKKIKADKRFGRKPDGED